MRNVSNLSLMAGLLLAVGCGSSSSAVPDSTATSDGNQTVSCTNDPRVSQYTAGMKAVGNSNIFTFVITQAAPAPPALNMNAWTLQVLDASGKPATDANLTMAVPFMPDHGHPTDQTPQISAQGDSFNVSNIYFFMPGVWRETFTAQSGSQTDTAQFFFCVNG